MSKRKINIKTITEKANLRLEELYNRHYHQSSPHLDIAALLEEYKIAEVEMLVNKIYGTSISDVERQELLEYSDFFRYSGKYVLKGAMRRKLLQRLDRTQKLIGLCDALSREIPSDFFTLFQSCLQAKTIDLDTLDLSSLNRLDKICDWLHLTSFEANLPNRLILKSLLAQEHLLLKFKQQISHFSGREDELKRLADYLDRFRDLNIAQKQSDPLLVYGIGGIGKSTLIAKFIIQAWQRDSKNKLPFVYLDFDKIDFDINQKPFNPLKLAEEAFRQLSIQFPDAGGVEYRLGDIQHTIKSFLLDNREFNSDMSITRSLQSSITRENLYDRIFKRYINPEQLRAFEESDQAVLVVLDSFEEFQRMAKGSELYELQEFISELRSQIPKVAFILVGRTDYFSTSFSFIPYSIGPFDINASQSYLQAKEVNQKHRLIISKKAKGIPLALNLLANLVLNQEKEIAKKNISNFNWARFYNSIEGDHITEQLIIRNIEHISEDVRELGIPGIVVRKITPEIIKEVLAIPCNLGNLDDNLARILYDKLSQEVFLLEEFNDELYFRRDLRESIMNLINRQFGKKVKQIHDYAIAYYENKTDPSDRAEYLYHRLMRGDDKDIIEQYYSEEMQVYLENSLWEFNDIARIHLYARMGKILSNEDISNAPLKEWELYMTNRIRDIFDNRGEVEIPEVLNYLSMREKRTEDSVLIGWEAKLYERQSKFEMVEAISVRVQKTTTHFPVKVSLALAKQYELQSDYKSAFDKLFYHSNYLDQIDNRQDLFSWSFAILRSAKRLGNVPNQIPGLLEKMIKAFDNYGASLYQLESKSQEDYVKFKLPPIYKEKYVEQVYGNGNSLADSKDVVDILRTFYQDFLSKGDFEKIRNSIQERFFQTTDDTEILKDISVFIDNHYRLFLEEITDPGSISLLTEDFALFLEQYHQGNLNEILNTLSIKDKSISDTDQPSSTETEVDSQEAFKDEISDLVARDKLDKALQGLRTFSKESGNEDLLNETILLSSRYISTKSDLRKGILDSRDANVENNRIRNAILDILSEI